MAELARTGAELHRLPCTCSWFGVIYCTDHKMSTTNANLQFTQELNAVISCTTQLQNLLFFLEHDRLTVSGAVHVKHKNRISNGKVHFISLAWKKFKRGWVDSFLLFQRRLTIQGSFILGLIYQDSYKGSHLELAQHFGTCVQNLVKTNSWSSWFSLLPSTLLSLSCWWLSCLKGSDSILRYLCTCFESSVQFCLPQAMRPLSKRMSVKSHARTEAGCACIVAWPQCPELVAPDWPARQINGTV